MDSKNISICSIFPIPIMHIDKFFHLARIKKISKISGKNQIDERKNGDGIVEIG
jgi:hypothetical protein